jgi:RND family efflux transporter MFP subunit
MDADHPMTGPRWARQGAGRLRRGLVRLLAGAVLVAVGAVGGALVSRHGGTAQPGSAVPKSNPTPAESPGAAAPESEVEVVLSPEAVARAGIKTAKVTSTESSVSVRVPGTVMPHGYREVKVTPIVAGIVTRVHVELGTAVSRGAPLATLFSAELAEAQTKYLSMTAMLEADQKKLQRTQRLVEIGAASRQELEEITAMYTSRATELEAARQRLLLLGLTPDHVQALRSPTQVVSEVIVPAPIDGVITGRSANLGQVVGMGQELFVVTDLSQVWVVGDLYERDFQSVRLGSEATLTTPAYPGLTLRGRVTYIDPRVDPQTRTVKVRVEVPNSEGRLKLGMYMTVMFTSGRGESVVVVPRSAVQTIGERTIVFVPVKDEEGKFLQRVVRVGELVGDAYTILGGI